MTDLTKLSLLGLCSALSLAGCQSDPRITAARTEKRVDMNTGAASAGPVEVRVTAETWDEFPPNLAAEVTPLRVSIQNDGDTPIQVRYEDLRLVDARGRAFRALPPFRIDERVYVDRPVEYPTFDYSGFYVAPHYARGYPGIDAWTSPFDYDPYYYDSYAADWSVQLPTQDMIERALPEGVIDPGGKVSGFVYFEHFVADGVDRVRFVYDVHNARSGEQSATVTIPFIVRESVAEL